jgi:hypothetical protein
MSAAEDKKARLLEALRREPSPVRAQVQRRDALLLGLAAPLVVAVLLLASGVHIGVRPTGLVAVSMAAWGALALVATSVALGRGRSMLGPPRSWLLAAAVGVAPLLAITWFLLPWSAVTAFVPHSLTADVSCFVMTGILATAPLFVFLRVRREGDPLHPALTGAAAGAAAGAWGATLIDLHCEHVDPQHILLGHVAPTLVLAAIGAGLGLRMLRVRPAR